MRRTGRFAISRRLTRVMMPRPVPRSPAHGPCTTEEAECCLTVALASSRRLTCMMMPEHPTPTYPCPCKRPILVKKCLVSGMRTDKLKAKLLDCCNTYQRYRHLCGAGARRRTISALNRCGLERGVTVMTVPFATATSSAVTCMEHETVQFFIGVGRSTCSHPPQHL